MIKTTSERISSSLAEDVTSYIGKSYSNPKETLVEIHFKLSSMISVQAMNLQVCRELRDQLNDILTYTELTKKA